MAKCLYLLEMYKLVIPRQSRICHNCSQDWINRVTKRIISNTNVDYWNSKEAKYQKILIDFNCSDIMKKPYLSNTSTHSNLKLCLQYIVKPKTLTKAEKRQATRVFKHNVGLTVTQFRILMKQIYVTFGKKKKKKNIFIVSR